MDNKNYIYGNILLKDGVIDSLDDWNMEKEINLRFVDQVLDYLWEIKDDGSIRLIDRGYNDGIDDRTTEIRTATNELELTFKDFNELSRWITKKIC